MGDFIELIMGLGEFKEKCGVKGCLLLALGTALFIGAIIAAAYWMQ